jgi:hypothetical protein
MSIDRCTKKYGDPYTKATLTSCTVVWTLHGFFWSSGPCLVPHLRLCCPAYDVFGLISLVTLSLSGFLVNPLDQCVSCVPGSVVRVEKVISELSDSVDA